MSASSKVILGYSRRYIRLPLPKSWNDDTLYSLSSEQIRLYSCRPGLATFPVVAADDVKPKKLAAFDLVLIDTEGRPRRKDLRQLADRADLILVPSGVSPLEVDATRELLDFLTEEGAARQSRVILTRVPPVGHAAEVLREDLREGGVTVCNTLVRSYPAVVI